MVSVALLSGALGIFIGAAIGHSLGIPFIIGALQGSTAGFIIGSGTFFISVFHPRMRVGRWLRDLPFAASVAIKTILNFFVIVLAIRVSVSIYFPDGQDQFRWLSPQVLFSMAISAYLIFSINFVMEVNRMLGQKVLRSFTTGAYHRPKEVERIFLFMDVVGSTGIAERIGSLRFLAFLNEFFNDLSNAVLETRGEIHKYVGDEVIISWTVKRGQGGAPIECQQAFARRIEERSRYYQANYGHVPAFRSVIHAGPVVTGEMGSIKREIVFLGDTVNTAARLVDTAKELDRDFIMSEAALTVMSLPEGFVAHDLGDVALRGRQEPLQVYALGKDSASPIKFRPQSSSAPQ